MNLKNPIIVISATQGFFVGAFLSAATGGNYLAGEVGLVGLGVAAVWAAIPYAVMSIFGVE